MKFVINRFNNNSEVNTFNWEEYDNIIGICIYGGWVILVWVTSLQIIYPGFDGFVSVTAYSVVYTFWVTRGEAILAYYFCSKSFPQSGYLKQRIVMHTQVSRHLICKKGYLRKASRELLLMGTHSYIDSRSLAGER